MSGKGPNNSAVMGPSGGPPNFKTKGAPPKKPPPRKVDDGGLSLMTNDTSNVDLVGRLAEPAPKTGPRKANNEAPRMDAAAKPPPAASPQGGRDSLGNKKATEGAGGTDPAKRAPLMPEALPKKKTNDLFGNPKDKPPPMPKSKPPPVKPAEAEPRSVPAQTAPAVAATAESLSSESEASSASPAIPQDQDGNVFSGYGRMRDYMYGRPFQLWDVPVRAAAPQASAQWAKLEKGSYAIKPSTELARVWHSVYGQLRTDPRGMSSARDPLQWARAWACATPAAVHWLPATLW